MIISSVKINNFKSLINVNINTLKSVNLLYGYNNSGKSNILKFLEIVFKKKAFEEVTQSNISGSSDIITRRSVIATTDFHRGEIYDYPFYFFQNAWNEGKNIDFVIELELTKEEVATVPYLLDNALYVLKDKIPIILSGRLLPKTYEAFEIELTEVTLDTNIIYRFNGQSTVIFPTIKGPRNESEIEKLLQLFNDIVLLIDSDRYFQDEKFGFESGIELNSKTLKRWYYELSLDFEKNDYFKEIQSFINGFDIQDEENENFDNLPFKGEISVKKLAENIEVFLKTGQMNLPVKNFGTGIQQIFYILTKIFASKAQIILVEEFELNLSKRYQIEFLTYLKEYFHKVGKQLIFTSHSPYITEKTGVIDSHYEVSISKKGITSITLEQRGESGHKDWIVNH